MLTEDFRTSALLDWLRDDLCLTVNQLEPASSDASFRRYFRVSVPDRKLIVMDAPPDKENIRQFIKVAGILSESKVHVPAIHYQNADDGFLVLEDFGSLSYLDKLTPENADELYGAALDSLFNLQINTRIGHSGLPCYDEALLRRELGIFAEWFIGRRLEIDLPGVLWNEASELLIASALAQPQTCVHRDFHSRNLMFIENQPPGVIDFQDAVIGPVTYDLVSLLRDCYIAWPQEQIINWMDRYYQRLKNASIIGCSFEEFTRWFDLMGMQRHLKAVGIFSRLDLRDGKPGYLKDVPRTLNYVLEQTQTYPELHEFSRFLAEQVIPRLPA